MAVLRTEWSEAVNEVVVVYVVRIPPSLNSHFDAAPMVRNSV